jgi:hypothetical protein
LKNKKKEIQNVKKWEANRRSDDEMCIDHREFLTLHRQQLMMISSGNSAERDVPPFPRLFEFFFVSIEMLCSFLAAYFNFFKNYVLITLKLSSSFKIV